jgi:hypothetical protein
MHDAQIKHDNVQQGYLHLTFRENFPLPFAHELKQICGGLPKTGLQFTGNSGYVPFRPYRSALIISSPSTNNTEWNASFGVAKRSPCMIKLIRSRD